MPIPSIFHLFNWNTSELVLNTGPWNVPTRQIFMAGAAAAEARNVGGTTATEVYLAGDQAGEVNPPSQS